MKKIKILESVKDKVEQKLYQKKVAKFRNPSTKQDRILQEVNGLHEFDLVSSNNEFGINGMNRKRFVMLDSQFFSDYIQTVISRECSFETYIEKADIISGDYPKKISTLIKEEYDIAESMQEVVASRLLEFFGVPTSVLTMISDGDKIYTASIDFIKPDEELYEIFGRKEDIFEEDDDFKTIRKNFIIYLKTFRLKHLAKVSKQEIENMADSLIYSIFVRRFVLGDNDSRSENFAILFNKKTKKIRLAPNFDFGHSFHRFSLSNYETDIDEFKQFYPKLYYKAIEKLRLLKQYKEEEPEKYMQIFEGIPEESGEATKNWPVKRLAEMADEVLEYHENHSQNLQPVDIFEV